MRKPLATRAEVAEFLGVSVNTMEQWAYRATGPRYVKVGRHTRYDWADVEAWLSVQDSGGAGVRGAGAA